MFLPSKAIESATAVFCILFLKGAYAIWFKLVWKKLLFFSDFEIYSYGIFLIVVTFHIFS